MIIEVKKEGVYIPDYRNNLKLPESEQIKVHYRFLTPGERKKYIYTEDVEVNLKTGKVDNKVKYVQDLEGLAKAVITKIDNYGIKIGDDTIMIETIDKFYKTEGASSSLKTMTEVNMLKASPEVNADFL